MMSSSNRYISHGAVFPTKPKSAVKDEWITPAEFAEEYKVGRTAAYEAFRRLKTRTKFGHLVRARRSEIEERIARDGRI